MLLIRKESMPLEDRKELGMMKHLIRVCSVLTCLVLAAGCLWGCSGLQADKRIVRIALGQSETHPEYIGLVEFKKYVEEQLGDKFQVEIFPNELLGSTQKAIELTQTGAVDFTVAGSANLETFTLVYEIFSMPYLFDSVEAYIRTMEDTEYMKTVYDSTEDAGFRVISWYYAGTRNFYAKKPIRTPEDLKGMKIRVQQSPASISMTKAFGAAATPMSFGEVYTAIQQGVIDGAENNELALTNNKHGEVAKYYSYTRHQMVPDMLIVNERFLESLSDEEREVFQAAAELSAKVERQEWEKQEQEAKETAVKEMQVQFLDVDMEAFKNQVSGIHEEMLRDNTAIADFYEHIQDINRETAQGGNGV